MMPGVVFLALGAMETQEGVLRRRGAPAGLLRFVFQLVGGSAAF